ncbi:hypothetical protein AB0M43_03815 [Longispora sp. NPDC051575]|uniref:hypothetical protein n=1 Tax=Longispora sp. NPDC051575 TaxID=3154943 RepID=UPI0034207CC4
MYYTIERCELAEVRRGVPSEYRLWRPAYSSLTTGDAHPRRLAAGVLENYLRVTGAAPETVRVSVSSGAVALCVVHGEVHGDGS